MRSRLEQTTSAAGFRGDGGLLDLPLLGLFCSIKCPGELILKLLDLARELRDRGVGVVGGFHTPMEKECFDILLRGRGAIVWCPARSVETMRLKRTYRDAVDAGRLLIVSPFAAKQRRMSKGLALERNRFVAQLASRIFVAYASPGGNIEALCRELATDSPRKPLWTFDSRHTANLGGLGCTAVPDDPPAAVEALIRPG